MATLSTTASPSFDLCSLTVRVCVRAQPSATGSLEVSRSKWDELNTNTLPRTGGRRDSRWDTPETHKHVTNKTLDSN